MGSPNGGDFIFPHLQVLNGSIPDKMDPGLFALGLQRGQIFFRRKMRILGKIHRARHIHGHARIQSGGLPGVQHFGRNPELLGVSG